MICVDMTHRDWSTQDEHILSAIEDPEPELVVFRLGKAIAESSLGYFKLGQIGFGMFLKILVLSRLPKVHPTWRGPWEECFDGIDHQCYAPLWMGELIRSIKVIEIGDVIHDGVTTKSIPLTTGPCFWC